MIVSDLAVKKRTSVTVLALMILIFGMVSTSPFRAKQPLTSPYRMSLS